MSPACGLGLALIGRVGAMGAALTFALLHGVAH
jgi:hypothetical protein